MDDERILVILVRLQLLLAALGAEGAHDLVTVQLVKPYRGRTFAWTCDNGALEAFDVVEPLAFTVEVTFAEDTGADHWRAALEKVFENLARTQQLLSTVIIGQPARETGHHVEPVARVGVQLEAFPLHVVQLEELDEDELFEELNLANGEVLNGRSDWPLRTLDQSLLDDVELVLVVVDDHYAVGDGVNGLVGEDGVALEHVFVVVELDLGRMFGLKRKEQS